MAMDFGNDDSIGLGPDAIIKQFSDRPTCLRTLIKAVSVSLVSLGVTVSLSYGILLLIGKILEPWPDLPYYANVIIAVALFLFLLWPVACLFVVTIVAIGGALAALRTLLRGDFVTVKSDDTLIKQSQKVNSISAQDAALLLGTAVSSMRSVAVPQVAGQTVDWHSVQTKRGVFDILRIKLPHKVPSVVINSLIEDNDILPTSFEKPVVKMDIDGQVGQYFDIYAAQGAEQEVYVLLTPDVLWQLLIKLDSCDVLLKDEYIYFVWPEYLLSTSLFKGRAQQIEKFTQSLVSNLHSDTEVNEELVFKTHKSFLDSSRSIVISALWIGVLVSVATALFAVISGIMAGNTFYVINSGIYAVIVFIPGILVGVCATLSVALFIISFRTARYVARTLMSLPKVKKYVLYYEGRM